MQGRGEIRNDGTTETPKFVDDRGVPLDRRSITLRNAHPDSPPHRNGAAVEPAGLNGHVAEARASPAASATGPPT
jgi:hypothetical protein